MEKIYKKLMAIEIAVLISCLVVMFIPVVKIDCGTINNYKVNAWHAIFGIDKTFISGLGQFSKFSFLCLLPYLFLILVFVLNVLYDNKNKLWADFSKLVLFLVAGILFIIYLKLINYNSFFNSYAEVKPHLKQMPGNIISAILCFIGVLAAALEIVRDIIYKRD